MHGGLVLRIPHWLWPFVSLCLFVCLSLSVSLHPLRSPSHSLTHIETHMHVSEKGAAVQDPGSKSTSLFRYTSSHDMAQKIFVMEFTISAVGCEDIRSGFSKLALDRGCKAAGRLGVHTNIMAIIVVSRIIERTKTIMVVTMVILKMAIARIRRRILIVDTEPTRRSATPAVAWTRSHRPGL